MLRKYSVTWSRLTRLAVYNPMPMPTPTHFSTDNSRQCLLVRSYVVAGKAYT